MGKTNAENPWITARAQWNAHESGVINSRRMWQIVGLFFAFMTTLAIGGIIYIGSQSKFIPYIVQVDKLGAVTATKRVDIKGAIPETAIKTMLAEFIYKLRFVSPDALVQRKAIIDLFAHLQAGSAAGKKITDMYNTDEINPLKRAAKEIVNVEITSVVQQSDKSWQIYWKEEIYDRNGNKKEDQLYRANITLSIVQGVSSISEEDLLKNPLGLFVDEIFISKQL